MKKIIGSFLFCLFLLFRAQAGPADTTIRGVAVYFDASTASAFPASWLPAPTSATSAFISSREIRRSKAVIATALAKYPVALLESTLKAVYFFKSMSFFEVGYGGTNSNDAVYITNDGTDMGYTDPYLEQTFHHEFSSILIRDYPSLLDTVAWKKANIPGFDYNDPEAGVGAIRNNESSQEIDTFLCEKGFLTQYSYSSLENDVNTIAQNLFKPDPYFWLYAGKYPRIRQKVKLLIAFYNKLSPSFNETYFKKFNQ